jgi:hypothetical protein
MIDAPRFERTANGTLGEGKAGDRVQDRVSRLSAYAARRVTACPGIRAYGRRQFPGVE